MQHVVLDSGRQPVPGCEHNSFMAELFAILLVLNKFWRVDIYTDNQAVHDLISKGIKFAAAGSTMHYTHQHIWKYIFRHLRLRPTNFIQIHKVRAHVQLTTALTDWERWTAWANDLADKQARTVFEHDLRPVLAATMKLHERVMQNRRDIADFYKYIAMIYPVTHAAAKSNCKRQQSDRQNQFDPQCAALMATTPAVANAVTFTRDAMLSFPWGAAYLWRIAYWASRLRWPVHPLPNGPDISFQELYIDFMYTTGSLSPRVATTLKERARVGFHNWVLDDLEERADAQARTLSEQSTVWIRSLSWIHQRVPGKVLHGNFISRAKSLHTIGCSAWLKGISVRPILATGDLPLIELNKFYVMDSGMSQKANRMFNIPKISAPTHPADLDVSFNERLWWIRRSDEYFN